MKISKSFRSYKINTHYGIACIIYTCTFTYAIINIISSEKKKNYYYILLLLLLILHAIMRLRGELRKQKKK